MKWQLAATSHNALQCCSRQRQKEERLPETRSDRKPLLHLKHFHRFARLLNSYIQLFVNNFVIANLPSSKLILRSSLNGKQRTACRLHFNLLHDIWRWVEIFAHNLRRGLQITVFDEDSVWSRFRDDIFDERKSTEKIIIVLK